MADNPQTHYLPTTTCYNDNDLTGDANMAKRVLLCDDEVHILRAAEFKLKKAGYDVQTAADGLEAWEAIQQQKPHVLITDCQMPRMDGLELVRRLRSAPATADLPVIMLTAKGFELSTEQLAEQWGVKVVMAKPFSPRELLQQVEHLVGRSIGSEQPRAAPV